MDDAFCKVSHKCSDRLSTQKCKTQIYVLVVPGKRMMNAGGARPDLEGRKAEGASAIT